MEISSSELHLDEEEVHLSVSVDNKHAFNVVKYFNSPLATLYWYQSSYRGQLSTFVDHLSNFLIQAPTSEQSGIVRVTSWKLLIPSHQELSNSSFLADTIKNIITDNDITMLHLSTDIGVIEFNFSFITGCRIAVQTIDQSFMLNTIQWLYNPDKIGFRQIAVGFANKLFEDISGIAQGEEYVL